MEINMELNTDTLWKPLLEFPHILVSMDGKVFDTYTQKLVNVTSRVCDTTGKRISHCILVDETGKRRSVRLSRLIYSAFREVVLSSNVSIGYYNGDPSDDSIWNLFAYPKSEYANVKKALAILNKKIIDF